eukprot:CAMPEP_0179315738 /NCGR_PEP_ID=MMETSP0797-20121207/55255_1 /TAXON_ID=47934 /ORGANISM="Dinophysis acuminata, Strain DAEP01" /LENGTH=62 /DNA_ID=CAMNT_0021026349 /DNA_START=37 /DNA_END=225 /DNA_ORIENTATION=-
MAAAVMALRNAQPACWKYLLWRQKGLCCILMHSSLNVKNMDFRRPTPVEGAVNTSRSAPTTM